MLRFISTALLSTALALVTATVSSAENQELNASRSEVEAACDANGGFAWGTGASGGRYGCMTDDAWVEWDAAGDCEGGHAARKTPAGRVNAPGPALQF